MRKILKLIAFCLVFLPFTTIAQSPCSFGGINPFCTDENPLGISYPSGTTGDANSFLGQTGAGCLGSTPAAAWYYMRIDNPGSLLLYIEQYSGTTGRDVDFACWGPFPTSDIPTFLTDLCNGTYSLFTATSGHPGSHRPTNGNHNNNTGGWPYPANATGNTIPMTDCSFYADYTEWCFIPNAQYGEIYLLLLTNYSRQPAQISFSAVDVPYAQATTDCTVLMALETNAPVCEGQVLSITYPNGATSGITYRWSGPNGFNQTTTTPQVEIPNTTSNMSGYYRLVMQSGTLTDTVWSDSLVIVPTPQLSFSINNETQFCEGESVELTVAVTNHDFAWYTINGTLASQVPSPNYAIPAFDIHNDTTFNVSVSVNINGAECSNLQSVTFRCARASSGILEDQICVGQSYQNYGFTLPVQNIAKDTLLEHTYQNAMGCDSTVQLMLHVTSNPLIELVQNDPEHCVQPNGGGGRQDGNLVVSVTEGTGELQYTWTPSPAYQDPDSLLNINGGTYTLNVVDELDCQSSKTFVVEALPNPIACFTLTPESPSYLVGENIVFNNCSQHQTLNNWNMGDNHTSNDFGVTYVYNEIGAYTITLDVEDAVGCSDHFEKLIEVHEKMRFYLPNSFTPNGDGVNDLFLPVQMEVVDDSYTIVIYDRWGNIVFTTKDLSEGWDGTVGGKLAEKGTNFSYFATYKDYDGKQYEKRGTVVVLY